MAPLVFFSLSSPPSPTVLEGVLLVRMNGVDLVYVSWPCEMRAVDLGGEDDRKPHFSEGRKTIKCGMECATHPLLIASGGVFVATLSGGRRARPSGAGIVLHGETGTTSLSGETVS